MAIPSVADVHVDAPLSNISMEFKPSEGSYIADQIFPLVPVQKQSDKYFVWDRSGNFKNQVELRAPGTEYPEIRRSVSTQSYFCDIYHLAGAVEDEVRANSDPGIDLDRRVAETIAGQFHLNRELKLQSEIFTTGVWKTDVDLATGTDVQWSDFGASNPITDIRTAKQTSQKESGMVPNVLLIGQEVADILVEHPLFLEKSKYTSEGILEVDDVRRMLKVPKVVVGGAIQNTASDDGTFAFTGHDGTDWWTGAYIWGKKALLMYVTPTPSLNSMTAGYTFVWNNIEGTGDGLTTSIRRRRDGARDRDVQQAKHAFDNKKTSDLLGYFINNCIA